MDTAPVSAPSQHEPHPWIHLRRHQGPPKVSDQQVNFNDRLGALITKVFGSMWALYALIVWMLGWMTLASLSVWLFQLDHYPFPFLLFCSNLVQLWALPAIMVGQNVLSRASDRRAEQTYKDAEAILHECLRLQDHLDAQDKAMSVVAGQAGPKATTPKQA